MKKVLSIIIATLILFAEAANSQPTFSHISRSEGLSSISATDVYTDSLGIVWITTRDGLNRFDGTSIKVFRQENGNTDNTGNTFTRICSDGKGILYIHSTGGIIAFDTRTEHFTTIYNGDSGALAFHDRLYIGVDNKVQAFDSSDVSFRDYASLDPGTLISSISFKKDGALLVGTISDGLFEYSDKAVQVSPPCHVSEAFEDSLGEIWLSSADKGLFHISGSGTDNIREGRISSDFIRSCCEDGNGDVWIGSIKGLDKYERATGSIIKVRQDKDSRDDLTDSSIWAIRKDVQGNIWIATYFGGVNWFNPEKKSIKYYGRAAAGEDGLENPVVSALTEDRSGNIWVATEGGLNYLDRKTGIIKRINSPEHIKSLYLDESRDELWIAADYGGLYCLSTETRKMREFHSIPWDPESLPNNRVRDVLPFGADSLILATHAGVCKMCRSNGKCRPLLDSNGEAISITFVSSLFISSDSTLWIVSPGSGLFSYRLRDQKLKFHTKTASNDGFLNSKFPLSVNQDKDGVIWIATKDAGIISYNQSTLQSTDYPLSDLQVDGTCVYCISELPGSDELILTTNSGFSIFNPGTSAVRNFNQSNGFPFCSSYENALLTAHDGTIFVGGVEGLAEFREKDISPLQKHSNVLISRIMVDGEDYQSNSAPQYINGITLHPSASQLSVDIAVTNYISTDSPTLEYFTEGISKQWTRLNGSKQINYTKLPSGRYTLTVRPAYRDESFCKAMTLQINVPTPWYRTTLAYLAYILIISLVVLSFIHGYNSRIRLREEEELNKSKLDFFTNISHDIRTPLTIILSQMEELIQKNEYSPAVWSKMLSVYKNGMQLNNLVDELMEFSSHDRNISRIKAAPHNLSFFVDEFCLLFEEYAVTNGITLSCIKDTDRLEVWFDIKQMQKVLSNLISNAFKYTDEGGRISVRVYSENSEAVISVTDTGKGIPKDEQEKIFGAFYRIDDVGNREISGTGIGLAIVKDVIERHHGTVSVDSKPGRGTCFEVRLQLGYSHFSPEEMASGEDRPEVPQIPLERNEENDRTDKIRGKAILVVEDNDDVREMLKRLFEPYYKVLLAKDGKEGWDSVKNDSPDIVLSDVMMPYISGTQLCKKIKSDPDTCHIPVVLLTARVSVDQNIEGLLMGADDYIAKPFNNRLLLSRCNNLVNSRIMLQEKFTGSPQASARMLATNTMDKAFLEKVLQIVDDHIDDCEFDVAEFSTEIGVSRTSLFSKIKSVTGQTPKDFVMTIRLKKAATLLKEKPEMSIAEISERTGFSSQSHFSQRFKAVYHISPLNYRKG